MSSPEFPGRSELFLVAESVEDREARVSRIIESVANGAYQVPPREVADALVAFFRRDFDPLGAGNPNFDGKSC